MNYNSAKIKHLLARFDAVIGLDVKDELAEHEDEMLRLSIPQLWNIHMDNNAELEMEVGFEEFMFIVAEHTNEDLKKIETIRFYSLLDHIKNKCKENN